ncbi:MAG: hypothetical protein FWE60_01835 [Oscillospiraceae bacterium]|nr:hypothetical protein [Oscillospiraceae bacterium]
MSIETFAREGAIFIELKRKPSELIVRGLCGFLALLTLFLLTLSLIFTFGGDAPSLFGRNIYIVKTDAVETLKPGTALLTSATHPENLEPGNIVVFKSAENKMGLAEIISAQIVDNVYGFKAVSETGTDISLTQSQIVGRATQYSDFLGLLVGFAKSPAGVLVIAVIPCVMILIYEGSKTIFAAVRKDSEITPVKKQDETPTYIPRKKISAAMNAYSATGEIDDDDDEFSDLFESAREGDGFEADNYPLFKPPGTSYAPPKPKPPPKPAPKPPPRITPRIAPRTAPLSQKRLNQAIAEVNAKRVPSRSEPQSDLLNAGFSQTDEIREAVQTAKNPGRTSEISEIKSVRASGAPEAVKRFTPRKPAAGHKHANTASIPSLDRLLSEDEPEAENTRYNLDDILFSVDKNQKG